MQTCEPAVGTPFDQLAPSDQRPPAAFVHVVLHANRACAPVPLVGTAALPAVARPPNSAAARASCRSAGTPRGVRATMAPRAGTIDLRSICVPHSTPGGCRAKGVLTTPEPTTTVRIHRGRCAYDGHEGNAAPNGGGRLLV